MVFQFNEQMTKTCLEANGWEPGGWVTTGINADYCDHSLKERVGINITTVQQHR